MILTLIGMNAIISCNKEELIGTTDNNQVEVEQTKEYLFSKDVVINTGNTQAIMRVHANLKEDLAEYSARNFQLVEVKATESLKDALVRNNIINLRDVEDPSEKQEPLVHTENEVASSLAFELVEVENKNQGSHYAVSFFHPTNNSRASWKYYTHYSTAQQNLEPHVDIARHSFWRRVYFGLKYRASSSSNWSVLQNEWRKLSNNETRSYNKNPCYQYRARIKTKKSSAYTVSFY